MAGSTYKKLLLLHGKMLLLVVFFNIYVFILTSSYDASFTGLIPHFTLLALFSTLVLFAFSALTIEKWTVKYFAKILLALIIFVLFIPMFVGFFYMLQFFN